VTKGTVAEPSGASSWLEKVRKMPDFVFKMQGKKFSIVIHSRLAFIHDPFAPRLAFCGVLNNFHHEKTTYN
jgi:hypothetical protein